MQGKYFLQFFAKNILLLAKFPQESYKLFNPCKIYVKVSFMRPEKQTGQVGELLHNFT